MKVELHVLLGTLNTSWQFLGSWGPHDPNQGNSDSLVSSKNVPSFIHGEFTYIAFEGVMGHVGSALLLTENTNKWPFPWGPRRAIL